MNERFARAGAIALVDLAHEPEFALGRIRIRPAHCEVVAAAWRETLEPRVMQVLVALARAHGEVVSRDDLIEACWEGRIVGEDSIGRCIGRLRKTAEASGSAFSIETVSRVGYRLKIFESGALAADAVESATPKPDLISENVAPHPFAARLLSPVRADRSVVVFAAGALVMLMAGIGLWWLWPKPAAPPTEPVTSVAVLPFVNLSGDPKQDYFSDGFSEELLDDLANNPHLRVAARTSAFEFKGKNEDVQRVGLALRVGTIVEGGIREAGTRVRISVRMINTANGYNIWTATYDRDLSDILKVQDEISRAIAVALVHKLVPAQPLARHDRIDPAIYRKFLEAKRQRLVGDHKNLSVAFSLLKTVTAAQPDFADGFVYLADIAYQLEYFESGKRGYYISVVDEAAQKALSIDPYNGNARLVHLVLCIETENWSGATADIGLLRKNNPGKNALAGLRRYYEIMGFLDESVEASHKLQSLYPPSKRKIDVSINTLLLTDRYREAIDDAKDGLMRQPAATWPMSYLCDAYVGAGQLDRAREIERQYRAAGGDKPFVDECDLRVDIAAGDHAAARRILKNWEAEFPDRIPNAADIAIGYVYLGDFSEASDWFERSYDRHEMRFFDLAPAFVDGAKYRTTARWKALTQQPRFKAWQAEHDRIAAELAARGGAP